MVVSLNVQIAKFEWQQLKADTLRVEPRRSSLDIVESLEDIVVEVFSGLADEDGDDEEGETKDGVKETHNLPEDVEVSVGVVGVGVGGKISAEGEHEEEPDGPGDEVLDREAPPEFEGSNPPWDVVLVVLELGHGSGELAHSGEEHKLVPVTEGELLSRPGQEEGHEAGDGDEDPGNDEANPGVGGESEEGKDAHDDDDSPVANGEDTDGSLGGFLNGVVNVEDPASTEALEDSEEEHEVDSQVMVNNIEVGETPVEAEDGGEAGTGGAEHHGDDLSGSLLSPVGVSDDSGGGLNEGEGGVDTEGEQDNGEDEGPEVGSGEGIDSGGVGNEGEADGGGLVLDGRVDTLEVTDNGEDSESSEEGKGGVSEGNTERVTDDLLVDIVVGGVGSHDSHADTDGEEDLGASLGPHASVGELLSKVGADTVDFSEEVHTDTGIGVLKSETTHDHDEDEQDGEGDGDPDDVGGGLNTLEDAEVHDDPGSDGTEPHLPLELGVLVGVTGEEGVGVVGHAVLIVGVEDVLEEVSIQNR